MASQPKIIDAAEGVAETQRCPNCGEELQGEFCQACGQKRIHRHELGLKHFFVHAAHEITDLESNKVVGTFMALLFRPGRLTHEYLAGRKGRYITPVRLYLTFSALYFLFAWGVLAEARGGGVNRMYSSPGLFHWQGRVASPRRPSLRKSIKELRSMRPCCGLPAYSSRVSS